MTVPFFQQAEKQSFARVVAEEYVKLLKRRMSERPKPQNPAEDAVFRALVRRTIEDVRNTILPQIESGQVDVVVQSSGVIAVETDDRRIALLAPNQKWDDEFRATVKWRTKGNTFAGALISEAERRSGKPFPAYQVATPPKSFVLPAAEALLAGDRGKVTGFVIWDNTPQGHEFWSREAASLKEGRALSPEAEAAVRSWVRAAKLR